MKTQSLGNFSLGSSLLNALTLPAYILMSMVNGLPLPDFSSLNLKRMAGDGAGPGEIILILGAVLLGGFGSVLVLVFMAQLSNTSLFSSLPGGSTGSNATKVNQNIANGIVTASSFESIILIAGFGAIALAIFLLVFVAIRRFRGASK